MNTLSKSAQKSFRYLFNSSDDKFTLCMHPETAALKSVENDFEEIEAAGLAIFRNDECENVVVTFTNKGRQSVA